MRGNTSIRAESNSKPVHANAWSSSGSKKSNLDHVIISQDMDVQQWYFQNNPDQIFPIVVDGWIDMNDRDRKEFVKSISDHCLLYGEVR